MSIQYFGSGLNDTKPDRYTVRCLIYVDVLEVLLMLTRLWLTLQPHCDGECDGLPHKRGGRVATMVMYCGRLTSIESTASL